MQYGKPQIWALVDPQSPVVMRAFRLAGTGHPIEERPGEKMQYINSFQIDGGALVFHLFEVEEEPF